jgi:hypothetical protein
MEAMMLVVSTLPSIGSTRGEETCWERANIRVNVLSGPIDPARSTKDSILHSRRLTTINGSQLVARQRNER